MSNTHEIKIGSRVTHKRAESNGVGFVMDIITMDGYATGAWVQWPETGHVQWFQAPIGELELVKTSEMLKEELAYFCDHTGDFQGKVVKSALEFLSATHEGELILDKMRDILRLQEREEMNTHTCENCGTEFSFSATCPQPVPSAGPQEVCGGEPFVYCDDRERFTPQEF
jgi:hypothetical protein